MHEYILAADERLELLKGGGVATDARGQTDDFQLVHSRDVPPPPVNQIIYVKTEKGFEVGGQFDPVTVTGKISATEAFTGLADAGYTIDADSVVPRKQ